MMVSQKSDTQEIFFGKFLMQLRYDAATEIFHFKGVGSFVVDNDTSMLEEFLQQMNAYKCYKAIIDLRETTREYNVFDVYKRGETFRKIHYPAHFKIANVYNEVTDMDRFYYQIASDWGYNVRMFFSMEQAESWLDTFQRTSLQAVEIAMISKAKDIIDSRLKNPPAPADLAKEVGLSEYKLMLGFKELYNSTIFQYLYNHRLSEALFMLRNTNQTASEIAYILGYASPQHFNSAFKKKFGFTPNSVRITQ